MAGRNSLKTPINKALLTPCRRVGLSRPKKTPKPLNLVSPKTPRDTPSPLAKALPDNRILSDPLEFKTPLKEKQDVAPTDRTPLKRQEKKSKKLFDTPKNNNKKDLTEEGKVKTQKNKAEEQKIEQIKGNVRETLDETPVLKKKTDKENTEVVKNLKDEVIEDDTKIHNNETVPEPKNKKVINDVVIERDKEDKDEKINTEKKEIEVKFSVKAEDKKIEPEIKIEKAPKKPSMFRKETSSIKNIKPASKSPVSLGTFTTLDWLNEEEFKDLKEKEFDWTSQSNKKEENMEKSLQNGALDSEDEMFACSSKKTVNKRKRKNVKVIDSSLDEMEVEYSQENVIINRKILKTGDSESDSDEEFSKEPKKFGKKLSKHKSRKSLSTHHQTEKITKNDAILKSKKLKKEVKITVEKLSEKELQKYSENIESKEKNINPEEERKQVLQQINIMKALIKKKEQVLENLKQAQIYMNKHDPKKLNELTNVWLNGCRLAIADLFQLLKEHGPITMKSLLFKLQIPPEILQKLNISTDDE